MKDVKRPKLRRPSPARCIRLVLQQHVSGMPNDNRWRGYTQQERSASTRRLERCCSNRGKLNDCLLHSRRRLGCCGRTQRSGKRLAANPKRNTMLGSNDYGWTPNKAKREAALPAPTGSAVFGNIEIMSASEEKLVSAGICPRCVPQEGRPLQMRLLGDFGPMRAWQCGRCTNVWITSPPNSEIRRPGPDAPETNPRRQPGLAARRCYTMRKYECVWRWKCPFCKATWAKYRAWLGRGCPNCGHTVLIEWESPLTPESIAKLWPDGVGKLSQPERYRYPMGQIV